MGSKVDDSVLDAALTELAQATRMVALSGEPAGYAAAVSGELAAATLSSGDFSLGNGVVDGRRVSIAAKSGIDASAAGTADHIALLDEAGGRLLYVADCPATAISAGGTVDFASWDIELADPA
ncbi:MAG: hypothetical protein AAF205_13615 [Pseudomonadota bacterium]